MEKIGPAKGFSIKDWAEDDRPREKLERKGRNTLSDAELIALLINKGTHEESAVDLSKRILALTGNNLNELGKLSIKDLKKIKGIGEAKATTIIAALELGRRRKEEEIKQQKHIQCSKDSFEAFEPVLSDLPNEEFWIILLNRSNKIIALKRISEGGVSGTVVDPKIIFKHAIENLATSVILGHNHPSGNMNPSESDKVLTRKLLEAGKFLGIGVIDHLIIGNNEYYSFADKGMI
jgi:DNA repair protein RadC